MKGDIIYCAAATAVSLATEGVDARAIALAVVLDVIYGLRLGLGDFQRGEHAPIPGAQDLYLTIGAGAEELVTVRREDEGCRGVEVVVEGSKVAIAPGERLEKGVGRDGREACRECVKVYPLVGGRGSEDALFGVGACGRNGERAQRRGVCGEEEGVGEGGGEGDVVAGSCASGRSAGGRWNVYNEAMESLFVGSCDDLKVNGCAGRSCSFRVGGDCFRCSSRRRRSSSRGNISLSLNHCDV